MYVKLSVLHNFTRVDRDSSPNESPDWVKKKKEAE